MGLVVNRPSRLIATTRRLATLIVVSSVVGCSSPIGSAEIRVLEVVDGDTLIVSTANGPETVRLLGVDTPESVDPHRPVQCFGQEATVALTAMVPPGTAVVLHRDVEARDKYGRLLAYVHGPHGFVNIQLVDQGFADVSIIDPNVAFRAELTEARIRAQTAERGLWGACGGPDVAVDPPWPTVDAVSSD